MSCPSLLSPSPFFPLMTLFALLALAGPFLVSRVAAQTGKTTAVCDYAEWTFFKGNSPCQVWANLQAACDSNAPTVPPLDTSVNADATYPSPSGSSATACQCNVVAYNLMAGCSWCQPNVYSNNWVTESKWKAGCSSYNSNGLPSQASSLSSSIPPWALLADGGSAWESFEASSIALAGTTPTPSSGGFGTATNTGFGSTRTRSASTPTITGPFSGGDDGPDFDNINNVNLGKAIGIPVGIILGLYLIIGGIVLAVFMTRQKNRKAWYGPTAEYYRNGGRMDEVGAAQPLLGAGQSSPNPFNTPSPSGTPGSFITSPYQPTLAQTSPPPTGQYDPNAAYGGPGYPQNNTYYDPDATHAPAMNSGQQTGPTYQVPQV